MPATLLALLGIIGAIVALLLVFTHLRINYKVPARVLIPAFVFAPIAFIIQASISAPSSETARELDRVPPTRFPSSLNWGAVVLCAQHSKQ